MSVLMFVVAWLGAMLSISVAVAVGILAAHKYMREHDGD